MFESLPQHFRDYQLAADVRTLMLLRRSIEKGLVNTIGDLYLVLKALVSNSPKDYGPFTRAFYKYFLDIDIRQGETLDSAIRRSALFQNWLKDHSKEEEEGEEIDMKELIDRFLDQVHLSTYDIKKILDGEDILSKDNPNQKDDASEDPDNFFDPMEEAADYSNISLEELLERMKKVAQQQNRAHSGGRHWIGKNGISPYGQQGAAKNGIRAGGIGGGKMARKVIGDKNFYPVDTKVRLQDNNIDVALSYLKGIEDETAELLLDIPNTIREGVREGGLFLPQLTEKIEKKVQVILLIDNGGWSMTPHIKAVTKLFSKMKRRFAHDLKTYYYHNTIYGGVYTDEQRTKFEPLEKLLSHHKNYSFFVIGDADMGPYELNTGSLDDWRALKKRFSRMVWMNPLKPSLWAVSDTINTLRQIIHMFPLSPFGIEKAVALMNKKRVGNFR